MKRERVKLRIIGKRIAELRKKEKMSQEQFREKLGVSLETVKNWEQGWNYPRIEDLYSICDLLKCDFDFLIGRIDAPTHGIDNVCKLSGLSVDAVKNLIQMTEHGYLVSHSSIQDMLSNILSKAELWNVIEELCLARIAFQEMRKAQNIPALVQADNDTFNGRFYRATLKLNSIVEDAVIE